MGIESLLQAIEQKEEFEEIERELKIIGFVDNYVMNYDEALEIENDKRTKLVECLDISEKEFNEVYLKTFNNKRRINIFYGGSGSGKSEYIARRYILKYLFEKGHNGLFLRRFGVDVTLSTFPLLKKILNQYLGENVNDFVKIKESDRTFEFYNGNKIVCKGLDDVDRAKSITFEYGVLTDVWLEEANQMRGTEIKELNRRLRGKSDVKKEITISFNPVSKSSWLYKKYFNLDIENKKYYENKRLLILKTTIYDNMYATKEDIEELELEDDPFEKSVYLHGNFGVLSASDCIVNYNDAMRATEAQMDPAGEIWLGIDCAGMGDDSNVVKVRKGPVELDEGFKIKNIEEADFVDRIVLLIQELQEKYKIKNPDFDKEKEESENNLKYFIPYVRMNVDATGIGHGVASQLRTKKSKLIIISVEINSIFFGNPAKDKDKYFNLVTEMYFNLRKLFKNKLAKILKDDEAINETCTRKFVIDEKSSRRRIESKKDFKKRLGASPDNADALALAFYVPAKEAEGGIVVLDDDDFKDDSESIYNDIYDY